MKDGVAHERQPRGQGLPPGVARSEIRPVDLREGAEQSRFERIEVAGA